MLGFNTSTQKPAPGWATKLGGLLDSLFNVNGPQPTPEATSATSVTGDSPLSSMPDSWKVRQDRKSVYLDVARMDAEDELVSTAIDVYADHTVDFLAKSKSDTQSVRMRYIAKTPEVQKTLDALKTRLDLDVTSWQMVRDFKLHGSTFWELVIDRSRMEVTRVKQTVNYFVTPKLNAEGDKVPGWIFQTDTDLYTNGGKELEEWQIVPFLYGDRKGYLAIPQLASARKGYNRLAKMEDGMAVARLTRAYDRLAHHVPVKPSHSKEEVWAQLQKYKESITTRRTATDDGQLNQAANPLDVGTDYYLPSDGTNRGSIEVLTSNNTQLGNLNDVQYHREKLLARLKVPIAFLQLQSVLKTHLSSNSGGTGNIEKQFAKDCMTGQLVLIKALRRITDIELMLKHQYSDDAYTIELTPIEVKDRKAESDIELNNAQAASYFIEAFGALPPKFMANRYMNLTAEQQVLMDEFITKHGDTIMDSKVKTLKNAAIAPKPNIISNTPKTGSGNNNSPKAANAISQPPGGKQSIPLESLVDLFTDLMGDVRDACVEQGVALPVLQHDTSDQIRASLINWASDSGAPLV